MPTVHLVIKGKVQGVFYRDTATETAKKTGVTGWVKNTDEGHVEAFISGDKKAVEQFVNWCHTGPPKAKVTEVIVTPKPETTFTDFIITG